MYEFKQEKVDGINHQVRYYLETGGNKFYLMVTLEGVATTLHANNLVIGSINELRCRFIR